MRRREGSCTHRRDRRGHLKVTRAVVAHLEVKFEVKIQLDAKRSSASLKYLFTELVCNKRGGECLGIAPRDARSRVVARAADDNRDSASPPAVCLVALGRPRGAHRERSRGETLAHLVQGALSAAPLRRGRLRPHRQPVRSWGPHRLDKLPTLLYPLTVWHVCAPSGWTAPS